MRYATLSPDQSPKRERAVLRTADAARYLSLSEPFLEKSRLSGIGGPPYVLLGSRAVGYLKSDLDDWLQSRRVSSTSVASNLNK